MNLDFFLKSKLLNGWGLFGLIAGPICFVIIVESIAADLRTGAGVSEMIGFSVRIAVPFIYLVVAASSVHALFPSSFSRWWLRNRKYLGLCFAVAMAWQATFIYIMSNFYRDYYYQDVYLLRDEIEGSAGYIFLVAMVVTSFPLGRGLINRSQWKLLHTFGIYFLWAYPFSVYWWRLYYYDSASPLDYVYYWAGFIAVALRITAWGKKRERAEKQYRPKILRDYTHRHRHHSFRYRIVVAKNDDRIYYDTNLVCRSCVVAAILAIRAISTAFSYWSWNNDADIQ